MSYNLKQIFDFLEIANNLKKTYRFSSSKPKDLLKESSADHSWRLSLMSFFISDELKLDINKEKALKIAIIHDLVEAITGDIDFRLIIEGKVTKNDKKKEELKAIKKIKECLPDKLGNEVHDLFMEYEAASSPEARFIKALDKLETMTNIKNHGYKAIDMPEPIITYADDAVKKFPELKGLLVLVKKELKEEFEKGNIPWKKEYDEVK